MSVLIAILVLAADPVPLIDFDKVEPADGWRMSRLSLAEVTDGDKRALKIISRGRGSIRRPVAVNDWRGFAALRFRAQVEAEGPVAMRIMAIRGDGPAALLMRYTLKPGPWRDVVLPLKHWRDNLRDQVCDFSRIDQWMIIWNSGAGAVTVRGFELVPGERGIKSCEPTVEERLKLAFPHGTAKSHPSENFLLLSDVKKPNARQLLAQCEAGLQFLREEYGLDGELAAPAPLYLFQHNRDLHAFVGRLGQRYGVGINLGARTQTGAMLGRVVHTWGADDAEYAGEAAKAATYQLLGLGNQPNWIQAGLAYAVKVELGEPDGAAEGGLGFLAGKQKPDLKPFEWFFAKRGNRGAYQAYTILAYVRAKHGKDKLAEFWQALRASTKPVHQGGPAALAKVLGMTLEDLETDWHEWVGNKR